jgi:hypothetical protein
MFFLDRHSNAYAECAAMNELANVYRATVALCSMGLIISTAEYWVIAASFKPQGVYSWNILRLSDGSRCLRWTNEFGSKQVRALLLARVPPFMLMLSMPVRSWLFSAAVGLLIANMVVLRWRMGCAEDGSDRMNAVVLFTLLLCTGPLSTPFTLRTGLWFIALEACVCYAASGVAKVASKSWRKGEALYLILSTRTYGRPDIARRLGDRRALQVSLCWFVILMEMLFPLCLLLPATALYVFLGGAALFHLLCALIMGFNSFLWAFVATYPAVAYLARAIETVRVHFIGGLSGGL